MILLGLACASKHTMFVMLPFAALAFADVGADDSWTTILRRRLPRALVAMWPTWLTIALLLGPFVAWSPSGFWHSVISYPFGTAAHSYPIRGDNYGITPWMVVAGLVRSPSDYFPFAWIQLAVTLPVLIALMRWQRRQRSLGAMLLAFALTVFVAQFTSRYFNENHLGFIIFVVALGALMRQSAEEPKSALGSVPAPVHAVVDDETPLAPPG
jgi:4-amino-4-deoxy-L-arabinose transferase-like glycosyltransferase